MTRRCAIICSGPSVEGQDLSKIVVPKIGVNWSYKATTSNIHIVSTGVFFQKQHFAEHDRLNPDVTHKFCALPRPGWFTPKRIYSFAGKNVAYGVGRVPRLPNPYNVFNDGWVFAGGGPCALQVAVSFRFNDIVYVGLDLKGSHFYKENPSGWSEDVFERTWLVQSAYFEHTKPEFEGRGIRIRNTGKSPIFEHVPFEELWP